MLKFLGYGSAFNTTLGNNSAYIKQGESLFLIDCGSTVFHKLKMLDLLEGIKQMYIAITHTHPDHVGSLGEVIFYCYYILGIRPTIIYSNKELITTYLSSVGVTEAMYELAHEEETMIEDKDLGHLCIKSSKAYHVDTIPAYSLTIGIDQDTFYYSGDSCEIGEDVITSLAEGKIHSIYQDTCGIDYEGNPHLFLGKLVDRIPEVLRDRVYCMHLDTHIQIEDIRRLGFQIVQSV